MERLLEGYRRFRVNTWRIGRSLFEELAEVGQSPRTMVIACSDSRVDPQMIFDAKPGEIFVVRNVANLVPPYSPDQDFHGTSAALEFAVKRLKVRNIVVMGHGGCSGIASLMQTVAEPTDFIGTWMSIAAPARAEAEKYLDQGEATAMRACEFAAVKVCLTNLRSFPWIRTGVEEGSLTLIGCHFDIATGDVTILEGEGHIIPWPQDGTSPSF